MNSTAQIAVVTGVGKAEGLGFEVCRQLARQGIVVLLTARRLAQAEALAQQLCAEDERYDVRAYELDVTQADQVEQFAHELQQSFGKLDMLINNAAGIAPYGEQAATADLTLAATILDTTLFGAWRMCQTLLPLLRKSSAGRLVNVSSGAGSHGDAAFGLTSHNAMGTSYAVAKAALNALTAKLALEEADEHVLINAVCPGFTATFPGGEAMGARPVAEGAASIVWAALLPAGGPTGGFFRDGKPLSW